MINKAWWDYLVPRDFKSLLIKTDGTLREFIRTTTYGPKWLETAKKPNGVLRLKLHDTIPVVHICFFKGVERARLLPFRKMTKEHRHVREETDFESGVKLADDELVTQPRILVEIVEDAAISKAVKNGRTDLSGFLVKKPSTLFTAPAHLLLAESSKPSKDSYVIYQHIFGNVGSYPYDGYFYVGKSTRHWQKRWAEHLNNIRRGSDQLFHRKFREEDCLLYTSPSPRDATLSRMPSSA